VGLPGGIQTAYRRCHRLGDSTPSRSLTLLFVFTPALLLASTAVGHLLHDTTLVARGVHFGQQNFAKVSMASAVRLGIDIGK
jgi:hypothetical protein